MLQRKEQTNRMLEDEVCELYDQMQQIKHGKVQVDHPNVESSRGPDEWATDDTMSVTSSASGSHKSTPRKTRNKSPISSRSKGRRRRRSKKPNKQNSNPEPSNIQVVSDPSPKPEIPSTITAPIQSTKVTRDKRGQFKAGRARKLLQQQQWIMEEADMM